MACGLVSCVSLGFHSIAAAKWLRVTYPVIELFRVSNPFGSVQAFSMLGADGPGYV